MTTAWGPTGVDASTGTKLSKAALEQIRNIVAPIADKPSVDAFLDNLSTIVAGYSALQMVYEQSLPKTVRANLRAALKAALKLNDRINALDGQSRQFIHQHEPDGLAVLYQNLQSAIATLNAAQLAARDLPSKPGRLMDHPKLQISARIAHAIRTDLHIEPTTTDDGLFSEVLKIALRFIEGRERDEDYEPHVGQLMRKALRFKIIGGGPGQPTEFIPPVA